MSYVSFFFFFNDTATTEIYTLSLHDALPIYAELYPEQVRALVLDAGVDPDAADAQANAEAGAAGLEAGFDAFAANCVALISGCPISVNPRQYTYDLLTQAAQAPIPSSAPGESRQGTPGIV